MKCTLIEPTASLGVTVGAMVGVNVLYIVGSVVVLGVDVSKTVDDGVMTIDCVGCSVATLLSESDSVV